LFNHISKNKRVPCFSDPVINPLFARRAAKAAGKGILDLHTIQTFKKLFINI